MKKQSKIFKVKALIGQTITNGAGQSLSISKGDVGTFQVIGIMPGTMGGAGYQNQTDLLINVSFPKGVNGGSMHISSKGSDPNLSWDDNLRGMLQKHDAGKLPEFQILSEGPGFVTINSSRADGTQVIDEAKTFFTKTVLTVASVGGSVGILTGLYIASKAAKPTAWSYIGHGVLGLFIGGLASGVATKIFEPTSGATETSTGADGCINCGKIANKKYDI